MDKNNSRNTSPKKKQQRENEEEYANDKILESLTSKYTELNSTDLLEKTLEHLRENIKPGICLICIENVERDEAVWSCEKCYCILHLVCIQRWAKDSIANVKEIIAYKTFNVPIVWCCPKCRGENKEVDFPNTYKCFCGKAVNPKSDGWSAPHSCGETCGKPLNPVCGHNCVLLCHSGPCPPCPKQITSSCHCGQSDEKTLRCFAKSWSCGSICSTTLECEIHRCPEICHENECPPCCVPVIRTCLCSQSQDIVFACSKITDSKLETAISCGNKCKKPLGCGIHKCSRLCHEGDCGPCEQSCPCGKNKVQCLGDLSRGFGKPCGDTCGKNLDCDEHVCEQKCHAGNCGSCLQLIYKTCKCGQYKKEVLCSKEFVCTAKCRKIRDCGVHTCNKKCCPGDCPPCRNPCGKTLQCKNHKCEMICHRGTCYPCPVSAQVKCFCGHTVRYVPCGSEKKCKPPDCTQLCTKNTKCDHPEIQKHKCHYGDCPRCQLNCGKLMPCGHNCPNVCHSLKLNRKPCFKCVKPVASKCPTHQGVKVQCCKQDEACEETCGKTLFCGEHFCGKRCHLAVLEDCGQCTEPCGKPRPPGCDHECNLGCHRGPCQDCTLVAKVLCHCESETLFVACYKQLQISETELSCKNQCPKKLNCGHRCLSLCHSGECPPLDRCRRKVKATCRCKAFKKEMECFLLGDSKVLECSTSTCNLVNSKSPNPVSSGKSKRKPRNKKTSESNDAPQGKAENGNRTENDTSIQDSAKDSFSPFMTPVMYAVVAVAAVLVAGYIFNFSSSKV